MDEHLYIVTYDIGDQKRWREVFKLMKGYGQWVQLSVFQCRLNRKRHAELVTSLKGILQHDEDHVVMIDVGPAGGVKPRVVSLGMRAFEPVERQPIIV
jgi:CRISPR-associated protein Cas2